MSARANAPVAVQAGSAGDRPVECPLDGWEDPLDRGVDGPLDVWVDGPLNRWGDGPQNGPLDGWVDDPLACRPGGSPKFTRHADVLGLPRPTSGYLGGRRRVRRVRVACAQTRGHR